MLENLCSRSSQETKRSSEKDQKSESSKPAELPPSSPVNSRGRSPSVSPAASMAREEPLIQPPPRSKLEREDDEEGQEKGATEPKEPSPVPQRSRGREGQTEAPKPVKSEGRESVREERTGAVREEKKMRAPREEVSYVHYKFSSKLHYKTVPFDGLHITLKELKRKIMGREHLKATKADLQITNEQTGEEYTDDEAHIRKHSSVIVRRTPPGGVKPAGRTFIVSRSVSRSDSRFRSRSRSPGGFRSCSPGGRKPPPRELPQLELKGPTPGARRERERYRQWEKEYTDWCNKCYKDYDNQHPSINKTPPISSKPASGSGVAKAPTSKSAAASAKPSNKTVSKTQSDNTRKEKAQKVKPKEKAEAVKEKNDKMPPAQRRIRLNRHLRRKGSTETSASDRAPLGPEKMSSTSDRSASSSVSEGDRSNSTTEGAGRKELSASAERRASRERPGSAGERLQGSDREQDRVSGPDRDRDRVSRSVSRSDSRFRSRSRSPGGFRSCSPGGRKPPPRELPQLELKGPTPGARRERERYRQWEKEYKDWCNKCYKDYDNQHPSINKTPPVSSKPASGSGVAKAPTSKSPAAPAKPSNKTVSKTQSDNTRKEKAQKVKPKVKTEAVKEKNDKVNQNTPEAVIIKKKDSSSSVAKPIKTIKANPEDNFNSTTPKKEKSKSSTVRPPLLKTPPLSSQTLPLPHPSLPDGPRLSHDIRGRRDLPSGSGLLPMPPAQRRIKLNRYLGRKGSTETSASDRAPLGPEKMSSTSDRSASSSVSEGDRSNSTTEGAGRKELSASAERRASRERPGSAGERLQGSDREQDRVSGPDRDRDRVSGSDRDRENPGRASTGSVDWMTGGYVGTPSSSSSSPRHH
ncbi:E3 ubiquitin-protein ligase RBBP6-like [Hippoglossus hippoglossus]|uniref:E3 ubiquitin-protein ligase RBBP6-like n=1 Tax=Hippoglossus hippoglossus TaxID=8267 RepID=UPI00148CD671|nr:E3 ubiquitin-protein ligase RBBP6-like [Hippoglossus hippoglossus]